MKATDPKKPKLLKVRTGNWRNPAKPHKPTLTRLVKSQVESRGLEFLGINWKKNTAKFRHPKSGKIGYGFVTTEAQRPTPAA